ncbi:ABC transporter permease protein [Janibacter sp. HTCC2649]|uniref:ABC transporter permease n=1 Tax=Janibacter sp. HTCC2649 TaxID=313589 RepID=UPI0000670959|nr:ABC transporter permease [Janibacter sp. HTCC2649]EAQ00775.1 ABC transporter permease protein [Janibacter sp. HTCC2649]
MSPGSLTLARRVGWRVLAVAATLLGVALLVFIMLRAIPGDQITASLGTEAAALTPAQQASLREYYGIDQPLVTQFFTWLGELLSGNLGFSVRSHTSVASLTASALPVTLELAFLSIVVALLIGIPVGMLAAGAPNTWRDGVGQGIALLGLSIPSFLLASFLLTYAASGLGFNPNGQPYAAPWVALSTNLQQMVLPALTLGFGIAAPIARTTRTAVLAVRDEDFVRTARAKGVGERLLRRRHVLRNALLPVTTMTGLQLGYLLGGAVVVEQIFSLPGIGRQVLLGIQQKDYAVVQSTVLVIALAFVLVNVATDLAYRVVDPRVRAS